MSAVMDAQREVTWGSLRWEEDLPSDTDVEFQVAVSNSPDGPFEFVGPNGHWSTRFTTAAGEALPGLVGRYLRYKMFLHSFDGVAAPSVGGVQISFSGLQPSAVTTYEYDAAGNRTRKIVETDAGVVLEEVLDDAGWSSGNRINNLNQVMRRDVTDLGGTVSWAYTWTADGQLASKSDGTNTWDYSWDEDGRLTRVEGPGGLDVAFEYDSWGRLLRRVSGSDETLLEWDFWDLVQETGPDGTVTRYFCPQGELHRFQRGNDIYSIHADALGSVRMITDAAGRVVSEFHYGAFGETLESSVDGLPGGFAYRYVGSLGVRWDAEIGLYYMRNRWYDISGRFISREPIKGPTGNPYLYVGANPVRYVDLAGLERFDPYDTSGDQVNWAKECPNLKTAINELKKDFEAGECGCSSFTPQQFFDLLNSDRYRLKLTTHPFPGSNLHAAAQTFPATPGDRITTTTIVRSECGKTVVYLKTVIAHELLHGLISLRRGEIYDQFAGSKMPTERKNDLLMQLFRREELQYKHPRRYFDPLQQCYPNPGYNPDDPDPNIDLWMFK